MTVSTIRCICACGLKPMCRVGRLALYTCALSLIFFKYFNKESHVPSSSTWNLRKSFFYRGIEIGIENRVILLLLAPTTEFLVLWHPQSEPRQTATKFMSTQLVHWYKYWQSHRKSQMYSQNNPSTPSRAWPIFTSSTDTVTLLLIKLPTLHWKKIQQRKKRSYIS